VVLILEARDRALPGIIYQFRQSHPDFLPEIYVVSQVEDPAPLPEDPPCSTSGIDELRIAISNNPSSLVEMYTRGSDVFDPGGEDDPCLLPFALTFLSGGEGGPTDAASLATIRTGPDRSVIIIQTREDINGNPITPPASSRIQQWNGVQWISYCNTIPGVCPGEGTC
jgi:hypothetical protein